MQPTEQQLNHFHTFGFLLLPALLRPDEVAWITDEFEQVLRIHGAEHDGSKHTQIVPMLDHSERLCTLLDDARILGIAGAILGDDFNYAGGDGDFWVGDTAWHPDGNYPDLFAIKFAFYLAPLTRDTGSLRLLPGSHLPESYWRCGSMHPNNAQASWGITPWEIPGNVAIETNPGDLVIFNHSIFHASFGGSNRRRQFSMNLHKRGKTDAELARIDQYLGHHGTIPRGIRIGGKFTGLKPGSMYSDFSMYTDLMIDTATPERLRHLSQLHYRAAHVHPTAAPPRALPVNNT